MAEELSQKINAGRKNNLLNNDISNKTKQNEEFVLLTRTSSKGYSYPVKQANSDKNDGKKRREKVLTHEDGKRVRYFDDDDKYSLKSMVSCILKNFRYSKTIVSSYSKCHYVVV